MIGNEEVAMCQSASAMWEDSAIFKVHKTQAIAITDFIWQVSTKCRNWVQLQGFLDRWL